MTNPVPALFTILAGVTSALQATPGYGAPDSSASTPVYDGPMIGQDSPEQYVCVGWNPNGSDEAGRLATEASTMGTRADKLEAGTFEVTIVARDGDGLTASARTTVQSILEDVSAAAYSYTDTSFAAFWCRQESVVLRQNQDQYGTTVIAEATFAYTCQLV